MLRDKNLEIVQYFLTQGIYPQPLTLPVKYWKASLVNSTSMPNLEEYLSAKNISSDETEICISVKDLVNHILKWDENLEFFEQESQEPTNEY